MPSAYRVSFISTPEAMPEREIVSAVFLIGFVGDKVLAARNERGWDVPGGHLEKGESLLQGLRREVLEEAGATFEEALPLAVLSKPGQTRVMVFFAADGCVMGLFEPTKDALERCLLKPGRLVARYHGDRQLLTRLISFAGEKLGRTPGGLGCRA